MAKYRVGDVVSLKKGHPCGANEWKILRTGVDYKLECSGCGRPIWMRRVDFEKKVRKIQLEDGSWVSVVHYHPKEE